MPHTLPQILSRIEYNLMNSSTDFLTDSITVSLTFRLISSASLSSCSNPLWWNRAYPFMFSNRCLSYGEWKVSQCEMRASCFYMQWYHKTTRWSPWSITTPPLVSNPNVKWKWPSHIEEPSLWGMQFMHRVSWWRTLEMLSQTKISANPWPWLCRIRKATPGSEWRIFLNPLA